MPKRIQDRRVQRTRQLLQDALVSLMIEKGYEETTVQDIIDRANVGRATFYAHFADKDTLLVSRLEDLRELLVRRQREVVEASGDAKTRGFGFSLALLEHAHSHLALYQAIVGRKSGSVVLQRIQAMVADLVRGELAARERGGSGAAAARQRDLAVQYVTGAFMAVLTWWLDHGARLEAEEVDAQFRHLVMHGLARSAATAS
jgi:AcrR family transcriptional regulator